MYSSRSELSVPVAELGSEKPRQKKLEASSCRAGRWQASRCQLLTGTGTHLGTGITASPSPHRESSASARAAGSLPRRLPGRAARGAAVRGQLGRALRAGHGAGSPCQGSRLLAVGWEAPANTDQKIRSWFCCSSHSQPVEDNGKR